MERFAMFNFCRDHGQHISPYSATTAPTNSAAAEETTEPTAPPIDSVIPVVYEPVVAVPAPSAAGVFSALALPVGWLPHLFATLLSPGCETWLEQEGVPPWDQVQDGSPSSSPFVIPSPSL
jgi:hypothetical protein